MSRLLRRRRPNAANPEAERRAARERRRTLEQLERAASRARRRGRSELSEALREAAQALSREQDAAAAEALERAATALERLEVQVALAQMTLARQAPLARRAAATERALQLAGMGRGPSGQGATPTEAGRGGQAAAPGGGRQLSARLMNRLAALGLAQGPSTSAGGGGSRGRRGPPQASLTPSGDTHARSQVTGVGQQAVTALEGIGTDGEPTTEYRDVYPSYGVRVEEALADERIPASRRATVRRYFESIRPDESEQEEP